MAARADPSAMSTITELPHTEPGDERAGVETLFAGIALPFLAATLLICAGLVMGGAIGFALGYTSLLVLIVAVLVGIVRFIGTDDE
jgi:hypothetical protein